MNTSALKTCRVEFDLSSKKLKFWALWERVTSVLFGLMESQSVAPNSVEQKFCQNVKKREEIRLFFTEPQSNYFKIAFASEAKINDIGYKQKFAFRITWNKNKNVVKNEL